MTAYLIAYGIDPSDRLAATQFPDRAAALAAARPGSPYHVGVPTGHHAGGCSYVVETEEDARALGPLLAVFNGLTNSGVKKFADRKVGAKRLMAVLPVVATIAKESKMSEEQINATEPAKRGRKPVEGRTSGREQMDRYNAVAREAINLGLKAKEHTSSFEKYDAGERKIAELQAKIDAARSTAAAA
jgi:hypothetical protein